MYKRVLLALDGSEHAERALETTIELAKAGMIGTVHLVHVIPPRAPEMVTIAGGYGEVEHAYVATLDYEKDMGWEMLHQATRRLEIAGHEASEEHVLVGDPAKRIIDTANRLDVDLIVLGRRGLGGLSGMLLGSVTRKIEHAATCPILTVV